LAGALNFMIFEKAWACGKSECIAAWISTPLQLKQLGGREVGVACHS